VCLYDQKMKKSAAVIFSEAKVSSDGEKSVRIVQLRGLEQPPGDQSCGYYGMFFASVLQKLPLESPIEDAEKSLADRKAFESFRDNCLSHLLDVAKEKNETTYPWTENDIKRGALELVYQQELQTCTSDTFKHIHQDAMTTLRGFGLDSLRTNHPPIKALTGLQLALKELKAAKHGGTRVFLLGASIHYMALAVRKTREGNYTVVYVDPQNNSILGKTESELQTTMAKMEFKSWIEAGWQRDKIERLCMDTFNGVVMVLCFVLLKCGKGTR